jgi:Arc/MetJ-type ribon-helix-helix transcriptional regulator
MATKGFIQRGERVAISYKMPPNIYEKVNKLVYEEKKFSTVSDCITQALISFIDNQNGMGQFPNLFKEYIASDEGRDLMKQMMKEVLVEILSSQDNPQKKQESIP